VGARSSQVKVVSPSVGITEGVRPCQCWVSVGKNLFLTDMSFKLVKTGKEKQNTSIVVSSVSQYQYFLCKVGL